MALSWLSPFEFHPSIPWDWSSTNLHKYILKYIFTLQLGKQSIKMDLPYQSTPVQGANSLLSNLPSSKLTSSFPTGPGHSLLGTPSSNHAGVVISKIEEIFEAMTDCILGEKEELAIQLKSRSGRGGKVSDQCDRREDENGMTAKKSSRNKQSQDQFRTIKFPSKSPQEAWKFSKPLVFHSCLST